MRKSGVLLSVSSLPSKYGIGCFDEAAYKFVDDLVEAKQIIPPNIVNNTITANDLIYPEAIDLISYCLICFISLKIPVP